jgi:hypothetical protein
MQTVTFNTSGDGLWSVLQTAVDVVDMQVTYVNDDKTFGELRVYFDTASWDVNYDGLIYTDRQFKKDLHAFLTAHGLSTDVDYSEQGMQGDDYVSLDVKGSFLRRWEQKFGELTV